MHGMHAYSMCGDWLCIHVYGAIIYIHTPYIHTYVRTYIHTYIYSCLRLASYPCSWCPYYPWLQSREERLHPGYVCMHVCMYVCIYIRVHGAPSIYGGHPGGNVYTLGVYACMCVCVCVCVCSWCPYCPWLQSRGERLHPGCVCMYVCVCVCMCVCVFILP